MRSKPLLLLLITCGAVGASFVNDTLVDGKPKVSFILANTYAHYLFDYSHAANEALTIMVTPVSGGDPDLYVNVQSQDFPTRQNAEHKGLTNGRDVVLIPPSLRGSTIHISVQAYRANCNVSIVAHFRGEVYLKDSIPQDGYMRSRDMTYYIFDAGATASEAVFAYANIRGSSVMYVSGNGNRPDRDNSSTYIYKSWTMFHLPFVVNKARSPKLWPANNVFYIAMYAVTNSTYRLMARTNDRSHALLQKGVTLTDSVAPHEYHYYKFQADNAGCNVSIQLTPLSGDPDLYVSTTFPYPNSSNAEWMSTRTRLQGDQVTIYNAAVGKYWIGVRGFMNSTFTISASMICDDVNSTHATILQDGMPIEGSLDRGDVRLYRFSVSGATTGVSFSVSAHAGDPDLYIKRGKKFIDPDEADMAVETYGSDFITIRQGDPLFCQHGCDYYVLVKAAASATYTLTAKLASGVLVLQNGVSTEIDLDKHVYQYAVVMMDQPGMDLTISVTDLARGDPDLYVSTTNLHPGRTTNWTWKSETIGADSITIAATDPNACGACNYYVSVYAFTRTHVSILATWGKAVVLRDGEPQGGYVPKHGTDYYEFTVYGDHEDISFFLGASAGLSELYISQTERPRRGNASTYQYSQSHDIASKSVLVEAGSNTHCTILHGARRMRSMCTYYIAVYGYTASNYSLVASTNHAVTQLQNNQPIQDHIGARLYEYFKFSVWEPGYDLSIVVTKISGDPDLYLSRVHQYPNRTQPHSQTITSRSIGNDSFFIDNATVGTYYIGVYGYRFSTFTLLASLTKSNASSECNATTSGLSCDVMTLINGQPQSGKLHKHGWRYFRFVVTDNSTEVAFALLRVIGDPDLYVKYGALPTRHSYDKHSVRYGRDFVNYRFPKVGVYYAGIYAYSSCTFTIRASTRNIAQALQADVAIQDTVNKHESVQYYYDVADRQHDLSFILTPLSGDPDLNVTLHGQVYTSHYWLEDSVTIPHSDLTHLCQTTTSTSCRILITVRGFTAASFTLLATSSNETELVHDVPQAGSVHRNQYKYYTFHVAASTSVTITVTPTRGQLALFVAQGLEPPTATHNTIAAPFTYGGAHLSFVAGNHGGCQNDGESDITMCTYTIGVRGMSHAAAGVEYATEFSVVARTKEYSIPLQQGIPARGWAMRHTELFYYFDVPTRGSELFIQVTRITGDPDLYVSEKTTRPSRTVFDRRSIHFGSDGVVIEHANATRYYIGVYSFINSTYTITAQVLDPSQQERLPLVDGTPQAGIVARGLHRTYIFRLPAVTESLTFSLSTIIGDPDLNVTMVTTHQSIVRRKYGSDVIVIHHAPAGNYLVDVTGYQDASYTILAVTDQVGTLLLDGVPIRDEVGYRQYDYFEVYVDRTDEDLTVTLTAFEGDPDLYISDSVRRPSQRYGTYNFSSRLYGEDAITIPRGLLRRGYYYISVFGPLNNCSYSIMSTFSNRTILQDGVPQAGRAASNAGNYYEYRTPAGNSSLRFTLQMYRGRGDLYISSHGPPIARDPRSWHWRSMSIVSPPVISIPASDPFYNPGETLRILVHCHRNCSYAVTASSAIAVTTLQAGVTQFQHGRGGDTFLYSFDMTNQGYDMEVTVDAIVGGVSIQVSKTSKQGPWQWTNEVSTGTRLPLIDIPFNDPNGGVGTYYIKANVHSNSSFGLTAYAFDPMEQRNVTGRMLTDGLPQVALVKQRKLRYFRFNIDQAEDVTVSVTPRYGDPDLYITLDGSVPSRSNYLFHSIGFGSDEITVPRGSILHACGLDLRHCTLRVAVYAFRQQALCSITATSSGRISILEAGETKTGQVEIGHYREYVTYVPESFADLSVEVTNISPGDPDLFLAPWPHPNRSHYQYKKTTQGRDTITVSNVTGRYYYISVYGFKSVTFRLTVTLSGKATTLLDGVTQNGFVKSGSYQYYRLYQPQSSVTLMLHTFSGQAVMYASSRTTHPSSTDNQLTTEKVGMGIRRGEIQFTRDMICAGCDIYVSVFGTTDSPFSVLASSGGEKATLLLYSQPTNGQVDNRQQGSSVRYYEFLLDSNDTDVSLVVTTISGAVDLYVGLNAYPTRDSYKYVAAGDSGTYQAVDIDNGEAGTYYAAVFPRPGNLGTSIFFISASTDNTMLQSGTPQDGRLSREGSFFFVHSSTKQDLEISVQPKDELYSKDLQFSVFVSTTKNKPSASDNDFSATLKEGDVLRIPTVESRSCSQVYAQAATCVLYINVVPASAADSGKAFTIVASSPETIKQLQNRVVTKEAFNGSLKWAYYESYVSKAATKYVIELEPCIGETDLYVSYKATKPTESSSTWNSKRDDALDIIEINENRFFDSSMYIGVNLASGSHALYKIRGSIFYPDDPLSSNKSYTPTDTLLQVVPQSDGAAKVVWNTKGLGGKDKYHTLYWVPRDFAKRMETITYSACGLREG